LAGAGSRLDGWFLVARGRCLLEPHSLGEGLPRGLCAHRRTGSPGSWLPRRRDLRGPGRPGRVNVFERWETQAALETFRNSGPDTEQRRAMLTVSVQEYDIPDVRPVFGKEAK
jgi:hypothetical protein